MSSPVAMASRPRLIAHAAVESYSVLIRLPPPHRAQPSIVHTFITERFTARFITLWETGYQELLATVAASHILGGPTTWACRPATAGPRIRLVHESWPCQVRSTCSADRYRRPAAVPCWVYTPYA